MREKKRIIKVIYFIILGVILFNFNKLSVLAKETDISYVKCGTARGIPKPVPQITTLAYTLLVVGTPIILVAFSIITLIKAISSNKEEEITKAKGKLLRKLVIAALIFLTYPIVRFAVNRIAVKDSDKSSFGSCLNCFLFYSSSNCPYDSKGSGNEVTSNTTIPDDPTRSRGDSNIVSNSTKYTPGSVTNNNPGLVKGTYHGKNYALYIPETVEKDKPLIVFLHGTGERGLSINSLANDGGLYKHITQDNAKYNTYILMPQISQNDLWYNQNIMTQVKELIDQVVEENGIDKNRISIWGFSLGANEAPFYVKAYPDYFASSVLISCAYNDTNPTYYKNVPVYIFQGVGDTHGNPGSAYAANINKIGGNATLKKYPNQGHPNFVKRVIEDTQLDSNYSTIFEWTLTQRKK